MSNQKSILPLKEAVLDPRCPYKNEQSIYNALNSARCIYDSAGRVVKEGDPELRACFIRMSGSPTGPLFMDLEAMARLMNKRRLSSVA